MPFNLKKNSRNFTSKSSGKTINYASYSLDQNFIEKLLEKENFKALNETSFVMVYGDFILDVLLAEEYEIKIRNEFNYLPLEEKIHQKKDFREVAFEFASSTDFTVNAFIIIIEKKDNAISGELLDFFNGMDDLKNFCIRTVERPEVAFGQTEKNTDLRISKINRIFLFIELAIRYSYVPKIKWHCSENLDREIENLPAYIPQKDDGSWYKQFIKSFKQGNGKAVLGFMHAYKFAGYFFPNFDLAQKNISDICGIIDAAILNNQNIQENILIAMLFAPDFIVEYQRLFFNDVVIASATYNAGKNVIANTKLLIPSEKFREISLIWVALINETNVWRNFDAQAVFNFIISKDVSPVRYNKKQIIEKFTSIPFKYSVEEDAESVSAYSDSSSVEEQIGASRRGSNEEETKEIPVSNVPESLPTIQNSAVQTFVVPEDNNLSHEEKNIIGEIKEESTKSADILEAKETPASNTSETLTQMQSNVLDDKQKKPEKRQRQKLNRISQKERKIAEEKVAQQRHEEKSEKEELVINKTPLANTKKITSDNPSKTKQWSIVSTLPSFSGIFKRAKDPREKQRIFGEEIARRIAKREAEKNAPIVEKPPQPKLPKQPRPQKISEKRIPKPLKKITSIPEKPPFGAYFKFAYEEKDESALNYVNQMVRPIYLTFTSPLFLWGVISKNMNFIKWGYFSLIAFYMVDHNYKQYKTQAHAALGRNYFHKIHFFYALAFALLYELARFAVYEDTSKDFITMDNLNKVHGDNVGITFFISLMLGALIDNKLSAENNAPSNVAEGTDSNTILQI